MIRCHPATHQVDSFLKDSQTNEPSQAQMFLTWDNNDKQVIQYDMRLIRIATSAGNTSSRRLKRLMEHHSLIELPPALRRLHRVYCQWLNWRLVHGRLSHWFLWKETDATQNALARFRLLLAEATKNLQQVNSVRKCGHGRDVNNNHQCRALQCHQNDN